MKPIQFLIVLALFGSISTHAALRPDKVHSADSKKSGSYVSDGLFVGGDRSVDDVVVRNIRWANNQQFERLVIDLAGTHGGDALAIPRAPYYQVAVSPDERRLVLTVWGQPKLEFAAPAFIKSLKKSSVIGSVELLPKIEKDSWTFVIALKNNGVPVEVFELKDPVRIIVDLSKGHKKGR